MVSRGNKVRELTDCCVNVLLEHVLGGKGDASRHLVALVLLVQRAGVHGSVELVDDVRVVDVVLVAQVRLIASVETRLVFLGDVLDQLKPKDARELARGDKVALGELVVLGHQMLE